MRKPIYLNQGTVALITLYTRPGNIEDSWVTDWDCYDEDFQENAEDAARQFISQLEGKWTPRFLKALKVEIDKALNK